MSMRDVNNFCLKNVFKWTKKTFWDPIYLLINWKSDWWMRIDDRLINNKRKYFSCVKKYSFIKKIGKKNGWNMRTWKYVLMDLTKCSKTNLKQYWPHKSDRLPPLPPLKEKFQFSKIKATIHPQFVNTSTEINLILQNK